MSMSDSGQMDGRRSRCGSNAAPWQLVEVTKEAAKAMNSSPNLAAKMATPPLRPVKSPSLGPADLDGSFPAAAFDWEGANRGVRKGWYELSGFDQEDEMVVHHRPTDPPVHRRSSKVSEVDDEDEEDPLNDYEGSFDPKFFVGDWMDNLGHHILVSVSGPRGGRNGRRRCRGWRNRRDEKPSKPSMGFLAALQKPGLPDKCFTIANDRGDGHEWTCGNGTLIADESSSEKLVWLAKDGRKSEWTRSPPSGEVYFDPPPHVEHHDEQMGWYNDQVNEEQWYLDGDNQGEGGCNGQYWMMQNEEGGYIDQEKWMYYGHYGDDTNGVPTNEHYMEGQDGLNGPNGQHYEMVMVEGAQEWTAEQMLPQEQAIIAEGGAEAAAQTQDAMPVVVSDCAEAAAAATEKTFGCESWNPDAPVFVPSQASTAAPEPEATQQQQQQEQQQQQQPQQFRQPVALQVPGGSSRGGSRGSSNSGTPVLAPSAPPYSLPSGKPWHSPKLSASATPMSGVGRRSSWGRTPTPSPKLGPVPAPMVGPFNGQMIAPSPAPAPAARKAPILIEFTSPSPDIVVTGNRMDWTLPETWGALRHYPRDFVLVTPIFGVRLATQMQVTFCPNGNKTSEDGHCSVALSRGPGAGIKFEFLVNNRGIGPKVCLGKRYIGDYPLPFDMSDEHKDKKVVVSMQILEIIAD